MRTLLAAAMVIASAAAAGAQDAVDPAASTAFSFSTPSIRITSPLGRTGAPATIRIVAQVLWPEGVEPSAQRVTVRFSVDGMLVGTVEEGPPYAATWVDENPFEPHEIIAYAESASGEIVQDRVALPPYDIVDRTEVASIVVEVGVYDGAGRAVSTLDASAFRLTENDELQALDLFARETLPSTIVLLVDNSQSMAGRMPAVRRAADQFARTLGAKDKVIVVPFNHRLGAVTGPTDDVKMIAESLTAMKAAGGTAILDALREATRLLDGVEGRRAVILITDGFDENSTIDLDTALETVERSQATVYTVAIGGVNGVSLGAEGILRRLTQRSGGRSYFPWRDADLPAVASEIAADAHNRYVMTYTPSNQKKNGAWRAISVEVPKGYVARARAGYRAASPPPIRPTIEFTVTDESRKQVQIAAEDLEVFEDGVAQTIDTFQEAVDPVSIVLVLDASGSMTRSAEAVRQTAREFVSAVRPEDSLAVITFADEPLFGHLLGANREFSINAIDKYTTGGGTALYDALWNALLHVKTAQGRRAVVVLTDGRDENNPGTAPGSTHTFDEVLELGRQVSATIFPIGLGGRVDKQVLETLASTSGGLAYASLEPGQLAEQFHSIIENLRQRYVVGYTSTNDDANGAWRSVEIRPRTKALSVSTNGGYFAPTQ
ncbi:MAG: VWA domain-containing protein [Vicinamibacterales bacterium]